MPRVLTLTISVPLPDGDVFAEAAALTRVEPALSQVKATLDTAGLSASVSHTISTPRKARKPRAPKVVQAA
jgi:hypothetical protein